MSAFPLLIRTFGETARSEIRLAVDPFNGAAHVDLRTWCQSTIGPESGRGLCKRAIAFPIAELPALVAAASETADKARDLGLLDEPRTKTE